MRAKISISFGNRTPVSRSESLPLPLDHGATLVRILFISATIFLKLKKSYFVLEVNFDLLTRLDTKAFYLHRSILTVFDELDL